jgi:maleylpyruvate isomerase
MKLYTYWRSSSTYRVRIALGLKQLPYQPVFVHLLHDGGEQHRPEFREKNALAQVPLLELDDGARLSQSIAIIEYLDERFPEPPLLPKDPVQRAQARELSELINSGIQPLQNLSTLSFLASEAPNVERGRWLNHFVAPGLAALERRAFQTGSGFLVGDRVSIADVLLVPQLYAARRFALELTAYPTLLAVEERCLTLEAFVRAHPDNQPDKDPNPA